MISFDFDIPAFIAATIAALSAVYSAYQANRNNQKKDMLEHLTSERLKDLYGIKKWATVMLNEASIAVHTSGEDKDDRIRNISTASNELWFFFKPVYALDHKVLCALRSLTDELVRSYEEERTNEADCRLKIQTLGESFRKEIFLYAHSAWGCIKQQILNGEQSTYAEFE